MFDLTGTKLVVIIVAALVVLGPEELPAILGRVGRLYGELKRLSDSVQSELRGVVDEPTRELRDTMNLARSSLADVVTSVRTLVTPTDDAAIPGTSTADTLGTSNIDTPAPSNEPVERVLLDRPAGWPPPAGPAILPPSPYPSGSWPPPGVPPAGTVPVDASILG